ncbi:hypothetical protein PC9H_006295 [Pleurotus ostreatus]|uniref:Uncharacterized protein n=1 Tax=Pleurotus ostreatus TaxID=5322 RepID=A0A8H6ZXP7_PLEOS|nr:uncharacterized protein PC9H_006295 [Pleurotus ostreatus]KAF7430587.1 hypothetical protein PC9H_006295 [Pleurotus ostreatus]
MPLLPTMSPKSPKRRTSNGSTMSMSSTANNLPPARQSRPLKSVSPPLASGSLHRFIYILVFTTSLIAAYYSWRVMQYKTEVGGWWNLALGRRPPQFEGGYGNVKRGRGKNSAPQEQTVEDRINALAEALGMPSKELASAIAVAVKEYVPPASLSSVAAKETGPAVEAMLNAEPSKTGSTPSEETAAGVVGGMFSGVESFVGMDEP